MTQEQLDKSFGAYKKPTELTIPKFQAITDKVKELAVLINDTCPESREKAIALTDLQSSKMWANASIAIHGGEM